MRILIAVHTYPPGGVGGAEQRAERTARALQRLGHDVRVLSVHWSATRETTDVAADVHRQIPVRRVWLAGTPGPFADSYDHPAVAAAAEALLREWRPDIVHQYSGYLTTAAIIRVAAAAQVPVVVSLTDYWWFCSRITLIRTTGELCDGPTLSGCALCHAQEKRRVRWPSLVAPRTIGALWQLAARVGPLSAPMGLEDQRRRSAVLSQTLASATALIAPSRFVADAYRRHWKDSNRLHVMRQGVEGATSPARPRRRGLSVGYLGQIKPHKGVDLLIDAWSMLKRGPHDRLSLIGSSEGQERYHRDLRRRTTAAENVEWRDAVSRDQIWTVLADLDALVVPSRWPENSPNTILEAQAARVPVIGARIGGIPELIDHGVNGLLFRPDDARDLAAALQTLVGAPERVDQMRQGSINVRTVDDEARDLVRLYEDTLGRTPAAAS